MPYKKRPMYRRKRKASYRRKSVKRSRRTVYKRRRTRRGVDKGTFLKLSSTALPVVIQNTITPTSPATITPDTFQGALTFAVGTTENGSTIMLDNAQPNSSIGIDLNMKTNVVYLGLGGLLDKYADLYNYMQVYKIVVKFTPAITEGGLIVTSTTDGTQFPNAISGEVTTDINRDSVTDYDRDYPNDLVGMAKSQSRRVSRNHRLLKGWTRTFVPSIQINGESNPKAKYQYKPKYSLTSNTDPDSKILLGRNQFIIRMRQPEIAGFQAGSLDGTELVFPAPKNFVRYGTLRATAYVKFTSPIF